MNILLDTHILLWALSSPEKISQHHLSYIENTDNIIFLSSISIVEIMIKSSIGKMNIPDSFEEAIVISSFETLDFTAKDAFELRGLTKTHFGCPLAGGKRGINQCFLFAIY